MNYRREVIYGGQWRINCDRISNYTGKVSSGADDKYLRVLGVDIKAFVYIYETNLRGTTHLNPPSELLSLFTLVFRNTF